MIKYSFIKKAISSLLLTLMVITCTGCYTMKHTVGDGARGNTLESTKQWYILWGLVPLNTVNSKTMAGGAKDYEVTTQMSFIDVIIAAFTSIVTVVPFTVEVKK